MTLLGDRLALLARTRQHHLVVDEVLAVGKTHQHVGTMHVAGVDVAPSRTARSRIAGLRRTSACCRAAASGLRIPASARMESCSIATRLRSLHRRLERCARMLAAVPPESVPVMSRTRPLTRAAGAPNAFFASSCAQNTPSSNGSESKPQENTMRAPLVLRRRLMLHRSSAASRSARRRDRNSRRRRPTQAASRSAP